MDIHSNVTRPYIFVALISLVAAVFLSARGHLEYGHTAFAASGKAVTSITRSPGYAYSQSTALGLQKSKQMYSISVLLAILGAILLILHAWGNRKNDS